MNKCEDRLMESVADLWTQLCEAEHKLCDWHGTIWQRLNGWMVDGMENWINCRKYSWVSEWFLEGMCESMVTWKSAW